MALLHIPLTPPIVIYVKVMAMVLFSPLELRHVPLTPLSGHTVAARIPMSSTEVIIEVTLCYLTRKQALPPDWGLTLINHVKVDDICISHEQLVATNAEMSCGSHVIGPTEIMPCCGISIPLPSLSHRMGDQGGLMMLQLDISPPSGITVASKVLLVKT